MAAANRVDSHWCRFAIGTFLLKTKKKSFKSYNGYPLGPL